MVDCSRDVYISFNRWEDTVRYSFVSHLSAAFHRRGISSYIREEDSDSESNGFSKLENCRASVVVLSEKYSSSKSCLEELVKVSNRRRNNCLVVVPVFYPVTKPFVKKQIWDLGDGDVKSALLEMVDLPGPESSDKQSDSDFIEEIVADVREKLNIKDNIGIYSKLRMIETLLYKQPWGVRSIGLWGMAGIGKTTLAEATFNQLSGDYEASCFIRDFNKAFQEKGLYSLLEEHFGKILKEELDTKSSIARPILLRNVLRHKRVLIVLDDVRKPLDAESFFGGFDWFSPGSLIIITSRDKKVFSLCRVNQIYEVPGLNEEEALQLFSWCASGKDIRTDSLQKLSMEVIGYAYGNPLALTFFGRESRKNPKELERTFLKLEQSPPREIHDAVKSTYDSLSSNEKNIFLDIACLLRGENLDCVMHLLEGCGFFPRVEINVLVEKCLVSISEGRVVMHNMIQSIGRKIINGGKRCSRLWEPLSIKSFLEDKRDLVMSKNRKKRDLVMSKKRKKRDLSSEDIEAIYLDPSVLSFDVNAEAFKDMYSLRYLKIFSSNPGNHHAL